MGMGRKSSTRRELASQSLTTGEARLLGSNRPEPFRFTT